MFSKIGTTRLLREQMMAFCSPRVKTREVFPLPSLLILALHFDAGKTNVSLIAPIHAASPAKEAYSTTTSRYYCGHRDSHIPGNHVARLASQNGYGARPPLDRTKYENHSSGDRKS